MYNKEVFEVLETFKNFMSSTDSNLNVNDIECIKLFGDSIRIEFWSLNHNQMVVIAEQFAEMMHCTNCRYEVVPDDWDNCIDGKIELSVGSEIPVTITVGLHSITLMI